jgi:hypothetical protein
MRAGERPLAAKISRGDQQKMSLLGLQRSAEHYSLYTLKFNRLDGQLSRGIRAINDNTEPILRPAELRACN